MIYYDRNLEIIPFLSDLREAGRSMAVWWKLSEEHNQGSFAGLGPLQQYGR